MRHGVNIMLEFGYSDLGLIDHPLHILTNRMLLHQLPHFLGMQFLANLGFDRRQPMVHSTPHRKEPTP